MGSGILYGADLGGHPAGFCPPPPHGQLLCSRRCGKLPACVSASRLPHFTAELAEGGISQTPGKSVWGAVGCGFGVVREQPSTVLPSQRSGGGRKRRREPSFGAALICFWSKLDARMAFPWCFVPTKELG